jgi:hypothetical protein
MLSITIPAKEVYDETKNEFVVVKKAQTLVLEHSLLSLSRWESKWCKAFLGKQEKTDEEILDYIKCMTVTPNVNPEVYNRLTRENISEINQYINAPMTATTFYDDGGVGSINRETITSELIYYWMIAMNIPVEFQKWHLNRLVTLIRVCNIKNSPPKKMSQSEIMRRNRALNEARKAQLNSRG